MRPSEVWQRCPRCLGQAAFAKLRRASPEPEGRRRVGPTALIEERASTNKETRDEYFDQNR
jgi:hypothetical protein